MRQTLRVGLTAVAIFIAVTARPAEAFCGFYVTKADTELFNEASQVVLVRDGDRTVMTMANDFRGDPTEFAMVIPVPTVLERDQIHVGDMKLVDHLDAYSAPRLVEYFDENPCQLVLREALPASRMSAAAPRQEDEVRNRALGVAIEGQLHRGRVRHPHPLGASERWTRNLADRERLSHSTRGLRCSGQLHQAGHAVLRGEGEPRGAVNSGLLVSSPSADRV